MFTGIVQGVGTVSRIEDSENFRKMSIQLGEFADNLQIGASVAVNGTCLTAVSIENGIVSFDIIQETLQKTNLGNLSMETPVNIERSYRVGDEIGGHQVMGHVDCTGVIIEIEESANNRKVWVQHAEQWNRYLVPKGWIAIDGISLTVIDVLSDRFSVGLIPETLQRTTLGRKTTGDLVNLEFDHQTKVIVATIERLLPTYLANQQSSTP